MWLRTPPAPEVTMFPKPKPSLSPNTYAYESEPLVKPTGFREYDARWLFEKEINLMGVQALGMGLGTLIRQMGVRPEIVVAHDFRSYSAAIKYALISGLMAAGCKVHDIGLAVTPMAYFAQFALDIPCVAMVTASHNDNGWTGVKMGAQRPLTFGPDEMGRLRDIVLGAKFDLAGGGAYVFVENFADRFFGGVIVAADEHGGLAAREHGIDHGDVANRVECLHKVSVWKLDLQLFHQRFIVVREEPQYPVDGRRIGDGIGRVNDGFSFQVLRAGQPQRFRGCRALDRQNQQLAECGCIGKRAGRTGRILRCPFRQLFGRPCADHDLVAVLEEPAGQYLRDNA